MNSYPDRPNKNIINNYLEKYETLENYMLQEKSLNLLFNFCPENKVVEHNFNTSGREGGFK